MLNMILRRYIQFAILLGLLAFASWQAWVAFIGAALGPDSGYYLMLSKRILAGAVPYEDFKILHPIGAFYQQALLLSLFGSSVDVVKGQFIFYHIAVICLCGWASRLAFHAPLSAVLVGSLVYIICLPGLDAFNFVIEPISSFWGWSSICLTLIAGKHLRPSPFLILLAGICGGLAVAQKQIGVLFVIPTLTALWRCNKAVRPRVIALFMCSACAPFILFFACYPSTIRKFISQNLINLVYYAQGSYVPSNTPQSTNLIFVFAQWPFILVLLLGAIIARRSIRWHGNPSAQYFIYSMAFTGFVFLLPSLMRPYFHYYLFPLVFVSFCSSYISTKLISTERWAPWIVTGLCLPLVPFSLVWQLRSRALITAFAPTTQSGRYTEFAQWIEDHSKGQKRILVIPDCPQLYFLTGTEAATNNYEFYPDNAVFEAAATGRFPVFVVDRGHAMLSHYKQELSSRGLIELETHGPLAFWGKPTK